MKHQSIHPHSIGDRVRINEDCFCSEWSGLIGIVIDRFLDGLTAVIRVQIDNKRVLTVVANHADKID